MTVQRTSRPIVGYRCWVAHRGRLRAAGWDDYWSSGVLEARCGEDHPHQAPDRDCTCGIYVCDSQETALRYSRWRHRWRPWLRGEKLVFGAVQLWGGPGRPVIVGELYRDRRGRSGLQYRAPYARIIALADGPHARRAGKALGVPVVHPDYLEAFAREVGGEQLRPPDATARALPGAAENVANALRRAAKTTGRQLGPVSWLSLRALARFAWWLLWWTVRIAWYVACRLVFLTFKTIGLIFLALIALAGYALGQSSPRRQTRRSW